MRIAIVGIAKTIDNDVPVVRLSFGFATALEKADEVIRSADVEARGAVNGIGLVKLMGRHTGFIAAGALVVSQEADFTLVPGTPFPPAADQVFLAGLERRMKNRGHAVIVVAEGEGHLLITEREGHRDKSGNLLNADIGTLLRDQISEYFGQRNSPAGLRYFDPRSHIRSVPANVYDRYLCDQMGRHAVHAAMAGSPDLIVRFEHNHYVHVPIPKVTIESK